MTNAIIRLRQAAAPAEREAFGGVEWKIPVSKEDLRELLSLVNALEYHLDSSMARYEETINTFKAETDALVAIAKKLTP